MENDERTKRIDELEAKVEAIEEQLSEGGLTAGEVVANTIAQSQPGSDENLPVMGDRLKKLVCENLELDRALSTKKILREMSVIRRGRDVYRDRLLRIADVFGVEYATEAVVDLVRELAEANVENQGKALDEKDERIEELQAQVEQLDRLRNHFDWPPSATPADIIDRTLERLLNVDELTAMLEEALDKRAKAEQSATKFDRLLGKMHALIPEYVPDDKSAPLQAIEWMVEQIDDLRSARECYRESLESYREQLAEHFEMPVHMKGLEWLVDAMIEKHNEAKQACHRLRTKHNTECRKRQDAQLRASKLMGRLDLVRPLIDAVPIECIDGVVDTYPAELAQVKLSVLVSVSRTDEVLTLHPKSHGGGVATLEFRTMMEARRAEEFFEWALAE